MWVGCTLTTDLPESSVASSASTTASTSATTAGSGGAVSACGTCTTDCCSNRCSELGCPNCDGQDWPSFCGEPTHLRAQCICTASSCDELVDCIARECFEDLDCTTGECDTSTGRCATADVAASSSTGATTNDCCAAHPETGCSDNPCENCVCFYEETCCTVAWDALCVNTALDQCASSWCRCR